MSQIRKKILSTTESICPVCFERIAALRVLIDDTIYLEKRCPVHGECLTKIWKGEESYKKWIKPKIPIERRFDMVPEDRGCPFDCGLCPNHLQHTCTAVLEVTQNCNLKCRFCFADSNLTELFSANMAGCYEHPTLNHIAKLLESIYEISPNCNLQISGGEPTLRADLPYIIENAKKIGFKFIQLNTNGLLLAEKAYLAETLKNSGLSSVFLQFDGTSDTVYEKLRYQKLYAIKEIAISQCIKNNIGVILVPTLVPGININEIGSILLFGLEHAPGVRGVHFQPVSYFGRHISDNGHPLSDITNNETCRDFHIKSYNSILNDKSNPQTDYQIQFNAMERVTIPEILSEIELQTSGRFKKNAFKPPSCEHAFCSFSGRFMIMEDGSLKPLVMFNSACCGHVKAEQGSKQAIESVSRQWCAPEKHLYQKKGILEKDQGLRDLDTKDALDCFIKRANSHIFSVSGMAFQDAWNIDLERLKGCCIHSVAPDGRLIPFCAYNITNIYGKGLYRKV